LGQAVSKTRPNPPMLDIAFERLNPVQMDPNLTFLILLLSDSGETTKRQNLNPLNFKKDTWFIIKS
jgi:hypothetical protein